MPTLSQEFDTTITMATDVLDLPHPLLPEKRRRALVDLLEGAFLPNVRSEGRLHKVTVPTGIDLGRVALLPVSGYEPGCYDVTEVIDRFDEARLPAGFLDELKQYRETNAAVSELYPLADGITRTGILQSKTGHIALGEVFMAVRAPKNLGQRSSSTIHEATHALLCQRIACQTLFTEPRLQFYLEAGGEVESYTTELILSPRTGVSVIGLWDQIAYWHNRQKRLASAKPTQTPFIYSS